MHSKFNYKKNVGGHFPQNNRILKKVVKYSWNYRKVSCTRIEKKTVAFKKQRKTKHKNRKYYQNKIRQT